jgi:hypothetical protein
LQLSWSIGKAKVRHCYKYGCSVENNVYSQAYGINSTFIFFIYLFSTLLLFRICREGIERKMNDELNKMIGTFSILIGGDYSGICAERECNQ